MLFRAGGFKAALDGRRPFCSAQRTLAAEPAEILARAADAARNTTYEGVILYRGDEQFDVLKVQHRFKDGSEREHLVALTGEPRQLLRIDNRLICILPKDHMVSIDRPAGMKNFLAQLKPERLRQLAQWYEFRDQGSGRIAGRDCTGVAVMPRDQFRYGYEIWADKDTGLPLKVTMVGQRGEMLEQVMFTEVSFPAAIEDSVFEEPADRLRQVPHGRARPAVAGRHPGGDRCRPAAGFVREAAAGLPGGGAGATAPAGGPGRQGRAPAAVRRPVGGVGVQRQRAAGAGKPFHGVSHVGPMEAYGRMVGSYHITIVGEVPSPAIRMIGDGVRPVISMFDPPLPPPPARRPRARDRQ